MNPGEPLTVEEGFLDKCRYKPSRFANVIRSAGGGGTFSHDATVLQVRLTTVQKLVDVRHLKCHGLGHQIANRLVTGL